LRDEHNEQLEHNAIPWQENSKGRAIRKVKGGGKEVQNKLMQGKIEGKNHAQRVAQKGKKVIAYEKIFLQGKC